VARLSTLSAGLSLSAGLLLDAGSSGFCTAEFLFEFEFDFFSLFLGLLLDAGSSGFCTPEFSMYSSVR